LFYRNTIQILQMSPSIEKNSQKSGVSNIKSIKKMFASILLATDEKKYQ
jgi:hypothetical protein